MPEQTPSTATTPSTAATPSAPRTQLRTLPLSKIVVAEGFNPRQQITPDAEYETLVATVRERGILQPIRVRETATGDFVVVAGHRRRYAAAIDAALMELPCVVVPAGAGDEAEQAELRVDALIENDVRVDLSPIDRAIAYAQLRRDGLTVRGIAQRLSTTQARVKEHLQVLELPEELHAMVADRSIPLHAIRGLAQLAKLHPELPALAVRRVLASLAGDEREPLRWVDFAADPIAVCADGFDHYGGELPAGVYDAGRPVELAELPLDEKATKALAALAKLELHYGMLRIDSGVREQAEKLGALHRSAEVVP